MKKFEFIKTFLLNIVTCGIYSLYMWIVTTTDHNTVAEKYNVPTIKGFIVALLLGIITCGIYEIIWIYKYCKQMIDLAAVKGIKLMTDNAIVMLIFLCIPIFSFYVLCESHNAIVDGE